MKKARLIALAKRTKAKNRPLYKAAWRQFEAERMRVKRELMGNVDVAGAARDGDGAERHSECDV